MAHASTMSLTEVSEGAAFPAPVPPGYGWYKFANHLHTNVEPDDGYISVKDVIKAAASNGATVCAITSHRTMNACSDGDFHEWDGCTPTCGEEWGGGEHAGLLNMDGGDPMVGWAILDMIASVQARGGFVIANHPVGFAGEWDDPLWPGISGVEVWSTIWLGGKNDVSEQWWQNDLEHGRRAFCIGGSDVHYPLLNTLWPCNVVLSPSSDAGSILGAVRNGCHSITADAGTGKCVVWADMENDGTYETLMGADTRIDEVRTIKLRAEAFDHEGDMLSIYTSVGHVNTWTVGEGNPWAIEFTSTAGPDTRDFFRAEVKTSLTMLSISNPVYVNTMPYIRNVTPNRAHGAGGTAVTIDGTNFLDEIYSVIVSPEVPGPPFPTVSVPLTVTFGGIPASNVVKVSFNQVTVEAPANPVDGPVDIVVNTVNGPATLEDAFTYDSTPPEITLNGDTVMYVECQQSFSDPGASADDTIDGDLTAFITVGGDTVDITTPGEYIITYDVSDSVGNSAEQKTRTIIVFDDTPPVITLFGNSEMHLECPAAYHEPGVNAFDECDKEMSMLVVIGGTVDTATPGTYFITYDVQDRAGNNAVQQVRTVLVEDTTAPVISLQGANPLVLSCHADYIEPGYTAIDACDGTLTASVIVDSSAVDIHAEGFYTVNYSVADASGNPGVQTRTVEVASPCGGEEGEGSLEGFEEGEGAFVCENHLGSCDIHICSEDTPKTILPSETTTSTLYVPVFDYILDVTVSIEIVHPRTEDLVAFLRSPNDMQILLFSYPGAGGANMTGTVLDDSATASIATASPPFTGSFRPQSPLYTFDYANMQGNWSLMITDAGTSGSGTLHSWSLTFNPCPEEGEGVEEGEPEGMTEGEGSIQEGEPEGITEGEGSIQEGELEGMTEGEGATEGLPTEGQSEGISEGEGFIQEGESEGSGSLFHIADQNADWIINLSELRRVIQFFNSGGLHCLAGTEDGYAPGASGDTSCIPHSSDYNPSDWHIGLSELLRLIQFFNSGGYHSCPGSEDDYCPGIA